MRDVKKEIQALKDIALQMVKNSSPILTGSLQSAIYAVDNNDGGFSIMINTDEAPHANHTLEQWTHPRWNGKKNPNEGWAYHASKQFKEYAKAKLLAERRK